MINIFFNPEYFFKFDEYFEIIFTIITFLIALYSLKSYRITKIKPLKFFSISFFLISISYLIQTYTDYFYSNNILIIDSFGIFLELVFFSLGLITLTYLTLKIKSQKAYLLIVMMLIFLLILLYSRIYLVYVLVSMLLIFLSYYYLLNYIKHHSYYSLFVFISFIFILFGQVFFIFSDDILYYIVGHIFELIGYGIIFINLILIIKHGKKTKSNEYNSRYSKSDKRERR